MEIDQGSGQNEEETNNWNWLTGCLPTQEFVQNSP